MEITPQKIREFRTAKRLTQQELGELLGQHWSCVSGWELGKWGPSKKIMPKLIELILQWDAEKKHKNRVTNTLKVELKQKNNELKIYKTLCAKQEKLIDQLTK